MNELVMMVPGGVPVMSAATDVALERTLQFGNHRLGIEHLQGIWKTIGEDVRRRKCIVIQKSTACEIPNQRVSPSAAVVTDMLRIVNDFWFAEQSRDKERGIGDT